MDENPGKWCSVRTYSAEQIAARSDKVRVYSQLTSFLRAELGEGYEVDWRRFDDDRVTVYARKLPDPA